MLFNLHCKSACVKINIGSKKNYDNGLCLSPGMVIGEAIGLSMNKKIIGRNNLVIYLLYFVIIEMVILWYIEIFLIVN